MPNLSVTVVIPAFNQATLVERAVRHARSLGDVEVLVSDGGSTDDTVPRALQAGARVVHAARSRTAQLEAAAQASTTDVLLFLDPRTRLPEDAVDHLRAVLVNEEVVGGSFYLRFAPFGRAAMALTASPALQRRVLRDPASRTGTFVRKSAFDALGGFGTTPGAEASFFHRLEGVGRTRRIPAWAETEMPDLSRTPIRWLVRKATASAGRRLAATLGRSVRR